MFGEPEPKWLPVLPRLRLKKDHPFHALFLLSTPTPSDAMSISTAVTELFNIKHPILLAGMNVAAGPELAAAVTNAGGLGVIGGIGYTPKVLRNQVRICLKCSVQSIASNSEWRVCRFALLRRT